MSAQIVSRICLSLMLAASAFTQSSESPLDIAKQELKDKTVLLRGFPTGSKLKYTPQGGLINPSAGIWPVDGFIHIDRIETKKDELHIRGERLAAIYDPVSAKMSLLALKDKVELTIPIIDAANFEVIVGRVFVRPPERMADVVPPYWKRFLEEGPKDTSGIDRRPATQRPCEPPKDGVYKICEGFKEPEQTYRSDPRFSELARKLHLPGVVTLTAVIDSNGLVRDVEIAKPRGAGLDEQAIASVSTWRFKPTLKDGQPVAVRIAVDVDFHYELR